MRNILPITRRSIVVLLAFPVAVLLSLPIQTNIFAAEDSFTITPWPQGSVNYRFDDGTLGGPKAVTLAHQGNVRDEMARWTTAMEVADPLTGVKRSYIEFVECGSCTEDVLVVRYNLPQEEGSNICTVGAAPGNQARLRMNEGVFGSCASCPNTIRHELGHCLGLWHEFNRADADRWLWEEPDVDGADFEREFNNTADRAALMPRLGNYDYDSLMHYSMLPDDGLPTFTDWLGYSFGRVNLDRGPAPSFISPRDKSRLLQYYAWESNRNWGFFKSLSRDPGLPDRDLPPRVLIRVANQRADWLPDPNLVGDVAPVGTPAIVFQSSGNIDFFVRGSNNRLYWGASRDGADFPESWVSLGCCFASDPAAISRADGEIDVFAIGAESGKLIWRHYQDGAWGRAVYVREGYPGGPGGGIKPTADGGGFLGPAVASRSADSLDVFVVRSDGRLGLTSLINGAWSAWSSLGFLGDYTVTARPAAIALSPTQIRLAINESDTNLCEPLVRSDAFPFWVLGERTASTWPNAAPALTVRDDPNNPYRVLIVNAEGRISHRFGTGQFWRDIGGIPLPGTGLSAVAAGRFGAYIVMNGEDATGCAAACADGTPAHDPFIQVGGLWLRRFE
jgi:hypothetical protein